MADFDAEVSFERRRFTRNSLNGAIHYQPTRRINLGVFSNYSYYDYEFPVTETESVHAIQAGVTYDHQLTSWLYLANSYSAYLNRVDQEYQDARIHRLQVGGLKFRLGRNWEASGAGGVEYVDTYGRNGFNESVSAGLTWSSRTSALSLSYHRGFFSLIGLQEVYQSDRGTAAFGSRLSPWINLQISGSFLSGNRFGAYGFMELYYAQAGLEFALPANMVASVNGFYVDQRGDDPGGVYLTGERFVAHVGLQYLFPGNRR